MTPAFIIAYQAYGDVTPRSRLTRCPTATDRGRDPRRDTEHQRLVAGREPDGVFRVRLWAAIDPYGRGDPLLDERIDYAYAEHP